MYVCICNSVTDRQIKCAVKSGHGSFAQVQQELLVATCCGCCEAHAREVIQETKAEQGGVPSSVSALVAMTTLNVACSN